ncbi:MAG: hypothetical protein WCC06_01355 [Candidatus Aminicenantales bacterium]
MKKDTQVKAAVLCLFALLTFLQLWPLPLHPDNSLNEQADSLLNTWILSWVSHQLFVDPLGFFNGNIFFPHAQTLSFSEHMLPLALISLPVHFLSQNPLLAYNFVLFLCFILNGFAMYLLVRYLTRNELSGVLAGIVFAFSTYQIQHITHLQLLSSWAIPLALLYLHKFFDEKRFKYSVLFAVFVLIQALACVYYGLFFISILLVALPLFCLLNLKKINFSFLLRLILPLLGAGIVLFPFALPYLSLFKNYNFQRELTPGADFANYLAVVPHNIFLGKRLSPLGGNEFFLFPGIIALFLTGLFLSSKRTLFKNLPKIFRWIFGTIILIGTISTGTILVTKGFELNLKIFYLSGHNASKPAFFILFGLFLFVLTSFILFVLKNSNTDAEASPLFIYLILLFWALFLSFGGHFTFFGHSSGSLFLPFKWFFNLVPGFKGIRVPSRYALFALLSIAILAGFGLRLLLNEIRNRPIRTYLLAGLFLFINLEYLAVPQQRIALPIRKDIPPTYFWLKDQPGDFAVMELPFHSFIGDDALYMYFSLFHKKPIVNGYSGYIPPSISYIRQVFMGFPSAASLDVLNALKVKYVVLHLRMWKEEKAMRILQRIEEMFSRNLQIKKSFRYTFNKPNTFSSELGHDMVFEVISEEKPKIEVSPLRELPPSAWEVKALQQEELLPYLRDGKLDTCWTTGQPKNTGDFLLIEFPQPKRVKRVSLHSGKFLNDFAIDLEVETSRDGMEWDGIELAYSPGAFAKKLIEPPDNLIQDIHLDGEDIRFLRITQVGKDPQWYWSVAELKIYESP